MNKKLRMTGIRRKNSFAAYAMSVPATALLLMFMAVPILYTIYYSLFQYQVIRPDDITFIGIKNYLKLFSDNDFGIALKNTVYFTLIIVPSQCALALALALLVSKRYTGVSVFRTMYFSPQLTSMVVISVLWAVLYNSNPNTGLINSLFVNLGLEPVNFLTNKKTAMNSIMFMSAWQGAGYQMMIFLAGLQGIPRDQYEAASIDGANNLKQFIYITMPNLKGTIKYVVMITMIQAMKLFTQPYIMTQGGPQNSTKTLVYYIYSQGFQKGNFGYACAAATAFFIIVVGMSLTLQHIISKNKEVART